MSKNVAVFVDVANIFYAAKAAGVDIDYVTLLKSATAGRDFVRAYAYTGLDPDNENQRQFHAFLARNSYKVVSKDIRKYGDGKVKANLDIELVVDMMKTARNLDIAVIVSGDGDFAPAIRAVQEMGVRVEVISFRGNTSSDLIEAADQFIEITSVAKVDKTSTRSGRRVASDDADLSMTEVPDKETEGTGRTRRRRTTKAAEAAAEPAAPTARTTRRRSAAATTPVSATSAGSVAALVALPGEKLSKAAAAAQAVAAAEAAVEPSVVEGPEALEAEAAGAGVEEAGGEPGVEGTGRRRRRRGGRGRGRRRGAQAEEGQALELEGEEELEPEVITAPATRRPTPFGSVWDAQIGTPAAPTSLGPVDELSEEELLEPEIPEYILAERRQRGQRDARGRGAGRGARGAYQAAIERERYGRGGMTGTNRYPDTSSRTGRGPSQPADRGHRGPLVRDEGRGRSAEPWSEVPPEIEAMLRAQAAGRAEKPGDERHPTASEASAAETREAPARTGAAGRGRGTRARGRAAAPEAPATVADAATAPAGETAAAPSRRRTRKPAGVASVAEPVGGAAVPGATDATDQPAAKRPARRRTSAAAAPAGEGGDAPAAGGQAPASKPAPTRRSRAAKADEAPAEPAAPAPAKTAAPRRRRSSTPGSDA